MGKGQTKGPGGLLPPRLMDDSFDSPTKDPRSVDSLHSHRPLSAQRGSAFCFGHFQHCSPPINSVQSPKLALSQFEQHQCEQCRHWYSPKW